MPQRTFFGSYAVAILILAAVPIFSIYPAQAKTLPPLGYQLMCLRTPSECRAGGSATIKGNDAELATLRRVNAAVNASIKPKYDAAGTDVWTVGASAGDCEDYALTKRHNLINAGFSPSALRMAYVKTQRGEGHAVLVVNTVHGDLVLDNLTGVIRPLSQSGLRLMSMASANPTKWM